MHMLRSTLLRKSPLFQSLKYKTSTLFPITRVPSDITPDMSSDAMKIIPIVKIVDKLREGPHVQVQVPPTLTSEEEVITDFKSIQILDKMSVMDKKCINSYVQFRVLQLIDKPLSTDSVIEIFRHLSSIKGENHKLIELFDETARTTSLKRYMQEISQNVIAGKYSQKDSIKLLYVFQYLSQPAMEKIIEQIKDIYDMIGTEMNYQLVRGLLECPRLSSFDIIDFLKTSCMVRQINYSSHFSVSITQFYSITRLIEKYEACDNSTVYHFLANVSRIHQGIARATESNSKHISHIISKICYCLEVLYKYEMLRDSYLGVTRRNYYNIERLVTKLKFVKFDTNQIEKIVDSHLSISKIAYVGDGFMSKIYQIFTTTRNTFNPSDSLVKLMEDVLSNINTKNIISLSEDPDRISIEHSYPHSQITFKLLALLFTKITPVKCVHVLLKINGKNLVKPTSNTSVAYTPEISLSDFFGAASPKLNTLVEQYLSVVDWEKLSREDFRNAVKFLQNNKVKASIDNTHYERAWSAFLKRSEGLECPFTLQILYWLSFSLETEAREYFKQKILPSLLSVDNSQRLSNPILAMTSSLRNVNFLVPVLMNINEPELLQNKRLIDIINLQVCRVIRLWDDLQCLTNLEAFRKMSAFVSIDESIMIKLVEQLSLFVVFIRNIDQFFVNETLVDQEFVKYIIWFLDYPWKNFAFQTGAFQIIFNELWQSQLRPLGTPTLLIKLAKLIGYDSSRYLPEIINIIQKLNLKDIQTKEVEELNACLPYDITFGDLEKPAIAVPDINASADEYEQYLYKVFRSKTAVPAHPNRIAKSREQKILSLVIRIAMDIQQNMTFKKQDAASLGWSIDYNKYKDELEEIFDIKITVEQDDTLRTEIPVEKIYIMKVEYIHFLRINRPKGYNEIVLRQYSAAEECLRTFIYQIRNLKWLIRPLPIYSFNKSLKYIEKSVLPYLFDTNINMKVFNPIIKQKDSTNALMIANDNTWRQKCIWSYILQEKNEYLVVMLDMQADLKETKPIMRDLFLG